MDFLDRIIDNLERNLILENPIRVGKLSANPESIAIRPTPSGDMGRYIDKNTIRNYNFQILVKGTNQSKVIEDIENITSYLERLNPNDIKSKNNSFNFIDCKVYVTPNYVEETDRGEFIYTAIFIAELQGGI